MSVGSHAGMVKSGGVAITRHLINVWIVATVCECLPAITGVVEVRVVFKHGTTKQRIDESTWRTGGEDAWAGIPERVEIAVQPAANQSSMLLLVRRIPPYVSDDFHGLSKQAQRVRNELLHCFYSGEVASLSGTYVYAQLCPQVSITVNSPLTRGTQVRIQHTEGTYTMVATPRIERETARFGDFVAVSNDVFVHTNEATLLRTSENGRTTLELDSRLSRTKRDTEADASDVPHVDLATSRFIELYVIVDSGALEILRNGGLRSEKDVVRTVAQIVSLSNAMMSRVNIWCVLVNVEVWRTPKAHRINYTFVANGRKALDGTATIAQLGLYRIEELMVKRNRSVDHVHLFTNYSLPHGYAALALIDEFCFWKSATISSLAVLINGCATPQGCSPYTIANSEYIAVALAHELGHSLGLDHDDPPNGTHLMMRPVGKSDQAVQHQDETLVDKVLLESRVDGRCRCDVPGNYCVMWPSIWYDSFPPRWSSCSHRRLTKPPPNYPMDVCLRNRPQLARRQEPSAVCGDLVVDRAGGEQCDCGPPSLCMQTDAANCCDPLTCRLRNATFECANGACCDTSTCSFAHADRVCREAINQCDLPERCNSRSAECPADVHRADATPCSDETHEEGYCMRGWCRTVTQQCRAILGPLATKPSLLDPSGQAYCTRYAHCRYRNDDRDLRPHSFANCSQSLAKDTSYGCTKLACEADAKYDSGKVQRIGMSIHSISRRVQAHGGMTRETGDASYANDTHCYYFEGSYDPKDIFSSLMDLNFDARMVQDGTKCGANKMCMNQHCRPIHTLKFLKCIPPCPADKVCNNLGKCQFENGTVTDSMPPANRLPPNTTRRRLNAATTTTTTARLAVRTSIFRRASTAPTTAPRYSIQPTTRTHGPPAANHYVTSSTNVTSMTTTELNYHVPVNALVAASSTIVLIASLALIFLCLRRTGKLETLKDSLSGHLWESFLNGCLGQSRHHATWSINTLMHNENAATSQRNSFMRNSLTGILRGSDRLNKSKAILRDASVDSASPLMPSQTINERFTKSARREIFISSPQFCSSTSSALKTAIDLPMSPLANSSVAENHAPEVAAPSSAGIIDSQSTAVLAKKPTTVPPTPPFKSAHEKTEATLDDTKVNLLKLLQDAFSD